MVERLTATVASNKDPAKAGRIKVNVASMDGDQYPEWIDPIWPAGHWIAIPEPGDTVEIEVPAGEDVVEFSTDVKYIGRRLSEGQTVPSDFKTNYPSRRGFQTKKGHSIVVDDKAGTFTITNGRTSNTIEFDATGNIILTVTTLLKLGGSTAAQSVMKGEIFNIANATMLAAVSTYLGLIGAAFTKMATDPFLTANLASATITSMTAAGTAAAGLATGAITTFLGSATTWLSLVTKTK